MGTTVSCCSCKQVEQTSSNNGSQINFEEDQDMFINNQMSFGYQGNSFYPSLMSKKIKVTKNKVIVTTAIDDQLKQQQTLGNKAGLVLFTNNIKDSEQDLKPDEANNIFCLDNRNKGRSQQKQELQNPVLESYIIANDNKKYSADRLNANILENKAEQQVISKAKTDFLQQAFKCISNNVNPRLFD